MEAHKSGHRTPPVIVELPVEGTEENIIKYNAWQIRQILAEGYGLLLCTAESADAVRAYVEASDIYKYEWGWRRAFKRNKRSRV